MYMSRAWPRAWRGFFALIVATLLKQELSASPIVGVDRLGQFQPAGTVIRFDSEDPAGGWIVGNAGISHVGAIDFDGERLWAASSAGGVLAFYTIDLSGPGASLVSTAGDFTEGFVFGGTFDSQHNFWVTDLGRDRLESYDPLTGERLTSIPVAAGSTISAIEFVGDTLYAVVDSEFGILDTRTGLLTPMAAAPTFGGSQGMDYDPVTGTMFATFSTGNPPFPVSQLYEIDIDTGGYRSLGVVDPRATLDAIAVIPEPGTLLLLAAGAACLCRRRGRCGFQRTAGSRGDCESG